MDAVPGLAGVSYDDSNGGVGTMFLAFTASGGGVYYTTDATNSSGLTDFYTGTFALTTAGTPTQLALEQQPSDSVVGSALCRPSS